MAWIKTLSLTEADEKLRKAIEGEQAFYPKEYAVPVHPDQSGASSIVGSHTLIPEALYHAFSTFGALMAPELPLDRRKHEMIATMVSVTNRCVY
jgi:alkylhydroperoxidase family enzyme